MPAITFHFWAVKILTTAMGEALSDYLVHTIDPYLAVGIGAFGIVAGLALQFAVRRYIAPVYWFAVAMVAVFGTMCADAAHIELKIPYAVSATLCAAGLAVIFIAWYAVERTLSIHSINTTRREMFYWAAVLATFAMGTAVGDMSAYTLHLGWLTSGLLFTVIFAIPMLARRVFGLNEVFAFWFAYVITRPLGASYADWVGVPQSLGGLNYGRGTVAVGLTIAIIAWVGYLWASKVDVERADAHLIQAAL
ncbi:MAG: COG4705 family protein [Candidatus Dormibacteraceae bacterium]